MRISRNVRNRAGWVIGSALIWLSVWFAIPAIGQLAVVNSGVTPRRVTRGDLSSRSVEVTVTLVGGA
jgi:hypothetical protein